MRILLAEGDSSLSTYVRKGLEAELYAVDASNDAAETTFLWRQFGYDLLLLDLSLDNGLREIGLLPAARAAKPSHPILALCKSARAEDRARALDTGADDVLTRPISFCELSARVRALLRRGTRPAESVLRAADLSLDRLEHTVERGGRKILLTAKEFALLEYLMRNRGRALSRAMIVEHVWNLSFDTSTNIVDVYVNYLRRKVDDGCDESLIQTVRGVGYRLQVTQEANGPLAIPRSKCSPPGASRQWNASPAAAAGSRRVNGR